MGQTVTTNKLHRVYGLTGEPLRRLRVKLQATGYVGQRLAKGGQTYPLLKELPLEAYLVHAAYRDLTLTDVESALSDAQSELECLRDEMTEWCDNMGQYDGLNQTDQYYQVEEAADALECLDLDLDVPDGLDEVDVYDEPVYDIRLLQGRSRNLGRGRRATNVAATIRNIIEGVQAKFPLCAPDTEINEFVDSLNEVADELEAIDFPTM